MKNAAAHDRIDSDASDDDDGGYRKVDGKDGMFHKGGMLYKMQGGKYMKTGDKYEKSALDENDLQKALDRLTSAAEDCSSEKDQLLQKAMEGQISESDNHRLRALLGGGNSDDGENLVKSVEGSMSKDAIQKSLDVSDFLSELHGGIKEAMESVADHIEKSDNRQHEFNVVLAQAVSKLGALCKSMDSRMETIENQPVGTPRGRISKSQTSVKEQQRNFSNQPEGAERLAKSQVLDTLEAMHVGSLEKGGNGLADCGEDLNKAISKYESTLHISRPLKDELLRYRAMHATGVSQAG